MVHPGPVVPPTVASLVLSGGGAKGAFEVGAVRYLYDQGIRPTAICGTSVGSMNALKLAEGEPGPAGGDPLQGLAGLENIWLGLQANADMWQEQPWLAALDPVLKTNLGFGLPDVDPVPGVHVTASTVPADPFDSLLGNVANALNAIEAIVNVGSAALAELSPILTAPSLLTLAPLIALMEDRLDLSKVAQWVQRGGALRLATVALESGNLRYVTESGQVVERDGSVVVSAVGSNAG